MAAHPAYHNLTSVERADTLQTLMDEWAQDWRDDLGRDKDGSMTWKVNACDVMLLIQEIYRLRMKASGE